MIVLPLVTASTSGKQTNKQIIGNKNTIPIPKWKSVSKSKQIIEVSIEKRGQKKEFADVDDQTIRNVMCYINHVTRYKEICFYHGDNEKNCFIIQYVESSTNCL